MKENYFWRKEPSYRPFLGRPSGLLLFFAFFALAAVPGCHLIDDFDEVPFIPDKKPSLKLMAEGFTAPLMLTEAPMRAAIFS